MKIDADEWNLAIMNENWQCWVKIDADEWKLAIMNEN